MGARHQDQDRAKSTLSVAMCTYNGERFLQEQLDSIASQTRLPDELIVCDDGSTDATLAKLTEYAKAVEFSVRIKCNARRLGVAKNFEQVISLCGGDIIVLSDQDDVWRHDRLQILDQVLSDNPDAGYAFSDAIIINETGKYIHARLWEQVSFDQQVREIFSRGPADQVRILLRGNVVTGATMAFRAWLKSMVLPVPESWLHDEWLSLASSMKGIRGVPIQEPLIYYRQHRAQARGVRRPGLVKRAWQSLVGNSQAYDLGLQKWSTAYALLKSEASQDPSILYFLETRVAHLALRTKLYRRPRRARVAAIATELAHGWYHFYSHGWQTAIKDLLTPMIRDSLGV